MTYKFDFDNKRFKLLKNTNNGKVDSDTIFNFTQKEELVSAEYHGPKIKQGHIVSILKENKLFMRYHCVTDENELLSGKAIALIEHNDRNKIRLKLDWEWLDDPNNSGKSEYLEL